MSTGRPKTIAAAPGLGIVSTLDYCDNDLAGFTDGPPNSYLGLDGAMIREKSLLSSSTKCRGLYSPGPWMASGKCLCTNCGWQLRMAGHSLHGPMTEPQPIRMAEFHGRAAAGPSPPRNNVRSGSARLELTVRERPLAQLRCCSIGLGQYADRTDQTEASGLQPTANLKASFVVCIRGFA